MVETVPGVKQVELSSRLVGSPAIVVGHESARTRQTIPCIYDAYTMHIRCIYDAYTMHVRCMHHAYAMHIYTMHTPCIYSTRIPWAQASMRKMMTMVESGATPKLPDQASNLVSKK